MKRISYVTHEVYNNNAIFDIQSEINQDNRIYFIYVLKEGFKKYGYDLSTSDINKIEESELVLYCEMPEVLPERKNMSKSLLLILESEVIRPDNWDLDKHKYFDKIFTWNDAFVDNQKYFKINFSHQIIRKINKNLQEKNNFCTLISGNKIVNHPLELYSKRVEAIKWFEKNHPDSFDLYGIGWDYYIPRNRYIRYLLRKIPFGDFFYKKPLSYKGKINSKREILQKYKFSICYENGKDISGYITEKIFDCFFAGCVPIYWGANNITEHIPKECFIDKREFDTYEKLYKYMKNMSDEEYMQYLDNIESFLNSKASEQFSAEYFANTIIANIL